MEDGGAALRGQTSSPPLSKGGLGGVALRGLPSPQSRTNVTGSDQLHAVSQRRRMTQSFNRRERKSTRQRLRASMPPAEAIYDNLDGVWDAISCEAKKRMAELGPDVKRGRRTKRSEDAEGTCGATPP